MSHQRLERLGVQRDGSLFVAFGRLDIAPMKRSPDDQRAIVEIDVLWTETLAVDIAEGFFTVPLGSVNAFDESVFKETELWLELEIDSETLSPRQPVAAVPWARRAFSVEGKVEATSITCEGSVTVGGNEVINASGQWVGSISIESNEFNCSGCVEATAFPFRPNQHHAPISRQPVRFAGCAGDDQQNHHLPAFQRCGNGGTRTKRRHYT